MTTCIFDSKLEARRFSIKSEMSRHLRHDCMSRPRSRNAKHQTESDIQRAGPEMAFSKKSEAFIGKGGECSEAAAKAGCKQDAHFFGDCVFGRNAVKQAYQETSGDIDNESRPREKNCHSFGRGGQKESPEGFGCEKAQDSAESAAQKYAKSNLQHIVWPVFCPYKVRKTFHSDKLYYLCI